MKRMNDKIPSTPSPPAVDTLFKIIYLPLDNLSNVFKHDIFSGPKKTGKFRVCQRTCTTDHEMKTGSIISSILESHMPMLQLALGLQMSNVGSQEIKFT